MGTGIAQLCALAGLDTILYDVGESALVRSEQRLQADLQTAVEKQKITATDAHSAFSSRCYCSSFPSCTSKQKTDPLPRTQGSALRSVPDTAWWIPPRLLRKREQ